MDSLTDDKLDSASETAGTVSDSTVSSSIQRNRIMQCGLCHYFAQLFRRAICIESNSRRGSGESAYQELAQEANIIQVQETNLSIKNHEFSNNEVCLIKLVPYLLIFFKNT